MARALRALVADGDESCRQLLGVILQSHGVEVDFASTGAEAVAAARSADFAVIFMGLDAAVADGPKAAATIRRDEWTSGRARTPLYVVSSDNDAGGYRAAGADGCLAKPVNIPTVVALAERCAATDGRRRLIKSA